jgi:hypothetical protein
LHPVFRGVSALAAGKRDFDFVSPGSSVKHGWLANGCLAAGGACHKLICGAVRVLPSDNCYSESQAAFDTSGAMT